MNRLLFALVVASLAACATDRIPEDVRVYELANGVWYDGAGFDARTMYVVGGTLRDRRPNRIDERIDLDGGFVVPPFADAHSHRPTQPARFAEDASHFLESGVYYVMNQGNLAAYRREFDEAAAAARSPDVLYANAQLTSSQSHSVDLWNRLVANDAFPGVASDDLEDNAYVIVESADELDAKWPDVIAARPDFIKVMIEFSEEHAARKDDPAYFGRSGLDPALLRPIVERAHLAGLRVSAHVETAADFHEAVAAGVDMIAHMPGYNIPPDADLESFRIDPADAMRAARQGVVVMTTTVLGANVARGDEAKLARVRENQIANLRILADAGVRLAIGSDAYSQTAVDEALNLASLEVFDAATVIRMLCVETPQTIFPDRAVGRLDDGAEASFLVLAANPLDDVASLRTIMRRFKHGDPLESAP